MTQSKVLLTGAAGFLGNRVAHRIALADEMELKALVHTPSGPGAMRLARLPAEIEVGSVDDRELMADLVQDCDGVINCAFGMGEAAVDGTRILHEVSEQAGVDSLVHLSTAVVHGHGLEGTIDENRGYAPDGEYGEWKLEAEREIERLSEHTTLQPSIIRPMIIYGPHGNWIPPAIEEIRQGTVLADGGPGTLNQIYVDNLVDMILLALTEPTADGEVFMAVDDEAVSWNRFYDDIAALLDAHPPIKSMSVREIELERKSRLVKDSVVPPARAVSRILTSSESQGAVASELSRTPWAEPMLTKMPAGVKEPIIETITGGERTIPFEALASETSSSDIEANGESSEDGETEDAYLLPSERYIKMQTGTGALSNEKAKELLGWEQRIGYEEAMGLIAQWTAHEGLV